MERDGVGALGDLDQYGIVCALMRVVLRELYAKASGLHPDRRVALRIESRWATQDLGRDLIFLKRDPRVIEGVLGQVAKQLAQRFRAVQAMAFGKSLYLLEALLPSNRK
jgi:hypothetical protein